jgi:FlaA1/EpsC-like NDP-sugar epimerase
MSTLTTQRVRQEPPQDPLFQHLSTNRTFLIVCSQMVLVTVSYYCSFMLRLDIPLTHATWTQFRNTLPFVLFIKLIVFYRFGLLRGWWRYVGMSDVFKLAGAGLVSSTLIYGLIVLSVAVSGYPRSVVFIDLLLTVTIVGGARFAVRAYIERPRRYNGQQITLIVGAGRAGRFVAAQLRSRADFPYFPIGFVDDDPTKHGVEISGLKVLGATGALEQLVARYGVECVLIAISSVRGSLLEEITDKCRQYKATVKILPALGEMLERPPSIKEARTLRIEDLLGRQPVHLDVDQIRGRLQDKVLLVTGAGGSIGSELVRQAAIFHPKQIVLFDRSENDMFKIGRELSNKFPNLNCARVVGDILDVNRLREVFAQHQPHSVFHAAAYKHVPMMEENCFQAITNNVFGTYNVALLAKEYHADDFVLISSDKAVNPTNIMGVTKRLAELIVLALQFNKTRFTAVRFGNVLGSNGSVVPIFQEQIANGGPVTVTHVDAKRYFMTITEAVLLVLQASAMGRGGEIFVLDMGAPINITDLANRMIRLAGFQPAKDVSIVYTGVRPGEKLFEELMLDGEGIKSTPHEKIRVLEGGFVDFEHVRVWLEDLSFLSQSRNVSGLVRKLTSIVPEYQPSEQIVLLSHIDRHDVSVDYRRARNTLTAEAGAA